MRIFISNDELANAIRAVAKERPEVERGYNGRSDLSQHQVIALADALDERRDYAETLARENRELREQVEALTQALAAYRSALRSRETETAQLRELGDAALATTQAASENS